MANINTFKVVIIGDGGVGKTALTTRLKNGMFVKQYIPTIGADVHSIIFQTNVGDVTLKIFDTAGQEKLGVRDNYYVDAKAAIIMYDHTSKVSRKNVPFWACDMINVCQNIPFILCSNKYDIEKTKDEVIEGFFPPAKISVRDGSGISDMVTQLLRTLTNNKKLHLTRPINTGPSSN